MNVLKMNWWPVALRGLIAIAFGLVVLIWPEITVLVFLIFFGVFILLDGLFSFVEYGKLHKAGEKGGGVLIKGIVEVIIAVITLARPGITGAALLILIAAWAIVTGTIQLFVIGDDFLDSTGKWVLGLSGGVSILFGILIIAFPISGATAIAWVIGLFALVLGVLTLVLAFKLRSLNKQVEKAAVAA